jgi:hypothetical protein
VPFTLPYHCPPASAASDLLPLFGVCCGREQENVFAHYFSANPDSKHPVYRSVVATRSPLMCVRRFDGSMGCGVSSTKNGIYKPNCGLANVKMSFGAHIILLSFPLPPSSLLWWCGDVVVVWWCGGGGTGHDEYLYQVCVRNGSTLPPQALAIIRYHSLYPWHHAGAYRHLMDAQVSAALCAAATRLCLTLFSISLLCSHSLPVRCAVVACTGP